jgi:hypothetical protein
MIDDLVIMFRPTGPRELELVAASGWRRWPPRLPEQPIFYPVTNQEYADRQRVIGTFPKVVQDS